MASTKIYPINEVLREGSAKFLVYNAIKDGKVHKTSSIINIPRRKVQGEVLAHNRWAVLYGLRRSLQQYAGLTIDIVRGEVGDRTGGTVQLKKVATVKSAKKTAKK